MEQWQGKVAVVSGASSGIGAAITTHLVRAGMIVVGLARRVDKVESLRTGLPANLRAKLHAKNCDVSKEDNIIAAFTWIKETLGGVDVVINNAGVIRNTRLLDAGNTQFMHDILDTNVMGLVLCTREAYLSMKTRYVPGHIININSITGHYIPFPLEMVVSSYNMYAPSKHAVTAITEVTRQELAKENSNIKITSISPGAVKTEIVDMDSLNIPLLNPEDIANSVLYVLSTPPHVQVHELIIKPVGEKF